VEKMTPQDEITTDGWLTQKQAAELVGRSEVTISIWCRRGRRIVGKLPFITVGPRNSRLINEKVLLRYAQRVPRAGYPAGRKKRKRKKPASE